MAISIQAATFFLPPPITARLRLLPERALPLPPHPELIGTGDWYGRLLLNGCGNHSSTCMAWVPLWLPPTPAHSGGSVHVAPQFQQMQDEAAALTRAVTWEQWAGEKEGQQKLKSGLDGNGQATSL